MHFLQLIATGCWQLKTPTRCWKCTRCTMQISYFYASDFPFRNFCKLTKQAETIRNYQKQVLVSIVWETHKLTWYQSCYHSQREIEVLFSTLKISPFPLARSMQLHMRVLVHIPCNISCHRCEKSSREYRNSHHSRTFAPKSSHVQIFLKLWLQVENDKIRWKT